jgi:uncharacterized repeat protein (TIGR01451 family)
VLSVENAGPTDARGAVVVDTMPAAIVPSVATGDGWVCSVTGQRVSCATDGTLPVGGAIAPIFVTGLISPDASGAIVNGATVEPQSPGTGDKAEVSYVAGDELDLDIAHFGPTRQRAGTDWTTTASVRNNGPAAEPGPIRVVIEQTGATPRRATGSGWTCDVERRQATCTHPGPLAMGASLASISIVSSTPASGTQANSVATVTGERADIDRSNNRSATSVVLERPADISVRKRAESVTVPAGGTASFRITVINRGPGSTNDAQAVDTLPEGLTFDRAASDPRCTNEQSRIQCSADRTLRSGESITFRLVARVASDVRGDVTNTVVASSSQPDPDPSNNRDRETITVTPPIRDQVPTIDPPDRIKDRGETELYDRQPPTNAGQDARVQVTCKPVVTRIPRGDYSYCRLQTRADGSIWIVVPGTTPLDITVRLTAPAVPGFTKMDVTYRYSTR